MASKPRTKMPISERAKQFMPFAALRGLPEALAEREKLPVPRIELSEEMAEELDRTLRALRPGDAVSVVYFCGGEYLRAAGIVTRIDAERRAVRVEDGWIEMRDILGVVPVDSR